MPLLPAMKTLPPGTSTGLNDPRSASVALSAAQVVGAKKLSSWSVGDSSRTESLPSYVVVEAPLPTDT